MKLQCQVDVVNRMHTALNVRSNGKYLKSTLVIGKEPKSEKDYFVLLFSSVNKSGTKYKTKFLKQVFTKCIKEGMSTLRFDEPAHDLCIKSETIQLKCFLKLLKSCLDGDKTVKISSNLGVTAKDVSVPTKLTIHNRNEFPSTGLPRTLQYLQINGLKLCNFRREILMLKHLVVLDLSNNEIEKIPAEFGRMPNLCELYLANNNIGIKDQEDWKWLLGPIITKKLKLLDLRANHLTYLPKAIWKLQSLITLNIDQNKLQKLPATLGRISGLRYLTASNNNLSTLPCSLMQCHLESADLSNNKFKQNGTNLINKSYSPWEFCVGNLVNIASKVMLRSKVYYAPNVIPWTLVQFLDNANMCVCGAPVLNDVFYFIKEYDLRDFFRTILCDNNSINVSFECYICSPKCLAKM